MAKKAKSGVKNTGYTGAYQGQPADLGPALSGVDTAWNEGGAPPGWYPSGDTGWSQTPPPAVPDATAQDTGAGLSLAPPQKDLASSPEWLAFLNSLGLEEGQFRADIERQRGVASNLAAQQNADIAASGAPERRNIAGSLETRGMARSGQFIRSLAEQRAAEARRQGAVQQNLTGTLSGLDSQMAQKVIDLGARRAQEELQLRGSGGYT